MITLDYIQMLVLVVCTAAAAVVDAKTRKIPNILVIVILAAWIAIFVTKIIFAAINVIEVSVSDVLWSGLYSLIAALVIGLVLILVCYLTGSLIKKTPNSKNVFGAGDIKLLIVCTLNLGLEGSFVCLLCACVAFLTFMLVKRFVLISEDNTAPFAPFIFIGVLIDIIVFVIFSL